MEDLLRDPFVSRIALLPESPIKLNAIPCPQVVSFQQATVAIQLLPDSTRKQDAFVLPGRQPPQKRQTSQSQSHRKYSDDETLTQENQDYLNVTRVQLLEHIIEALEKRETNRSLVGNVPEKLTTFYPILQDQSQHWGLNVKQYQAFVLMGSAILHHIARSKVN